MDNIEYDDKTRNTNHRSTLALCPCDNCDKDTDVKCNENTDVESLMEKEDFGQKLNCSHCGQEFIWWWDRKGAIVSVHSAIEIEE